MNIGLCLGELVFACILLGQFPCVRFKHNFLYVCGISRNSDNFFTARCYASTVLAMGLCPCLSQAGVLLKRQNVESHKQHHTIAQGL